MSRSPTETSREVREAAEAMSPHTDAGALLPCPFCGNRPLVDVCDEGGASIRCRTFMCPLDDVEVSDDTIEDVSKRWNRRQAASQGIEGGEVAWRPLPYSTPQELFAAFKGEAKFVLHYHGQTFDVTHMEPRNSVVYVQPPGLPVKVRPDGSSAEGSNPAIWLAALSPPVKTGGEAKASNGGTTYSPIGMPMRLGWQRDEFARQAPVLMDNIVATIADQWGSVLCYNKCSRSSPAVSHCRCFDIANAIAAGYDITAKALAVPSATRATPACDCGFAADACATNHCHRKQIASAGLSPVPAGYSKLPDGVVCKCFKMWRATDGSHWCCLPSPLTSTPSRTGAD